MKNNISKRIKWLDPHDYAYDINGVLYTVGSCFAKVKDEKNIEGNTLSDLLQHHLKSGLADLTITPGKDILVTEDPCLAAGKEAKNAARETE